MYKLNISFCFERGTSLKCVIEALESAYHDLDFLDITLDNPLIISQFSNKLKEVQNGVQFEKSC